MIMDNLNILPSFMNEHLPICKLACPSLIVTSVISGRSTQNIYRDVVKNDIVIRELVLSIDIKNVRQSMQFVVNRGKINNCNSHLTISNVLAVF